MNTNIRTNTLECKNRKPRLTKEAVHSFLEWCFDDSINDELINWSAQKICDEYFKLNGIVLSPQFVNQQRRRYQMVNGEIVRI